MDLLILPDATAVAVEAADVVEDQILRTPRLLLGLAGGSTPRATYEVLARRTIDWSGITAWMTDERWVPPDHPDSNQAMVRASIADETGVTFLAPDTTVATPALAAKRFDDTLRHVRERRTRAVTMLGMGPDGHTASLFPGSPGLNVTSASYIANFVTRLDAWRLTATFGLLGEADIVIFLVVGEDKAPVLAAIADGSDHPAARVDASDRVVWLVDEAAASQLA